MGVVYRSFALAVCLFFSLFSFGQKEGWLPVTQQDLQIKTVPDSAGADAIQLYYADYINDQEQTEFFYHRIKILNEKGNRHADVELVVPPEGLEIFLAEPHRGRPQYPLVGLLREPQVEGADELRRARGPRRGEAADVRPRHARGSHRAVAFGVPDARSPRR